MERRKKIIYSAFAFLIIANALVWSAWYDGTQKALTVSFLNVGQGDAIFIESPTGKQVLIDGGPANGAVLRELNKVMPFTDRHIDVIIATHPDADHIGGLPEVLKRFETGVYIESGVTKETNIVTTLETVLTEKNIRRMHARRGTRLTLGASTTLTILFPDRLALTSATDINETSIIALLSYKDETFLFTGDASQKVEKRLLVLDGELLDVDILKVGHHGSKTSTSDAFLSATTPAYAIISAGENNRYGHPHADVMARLRRASSTILTTAQNGTIIFKTNGILRTLRFK
jgi:competence protein ComEC